MGLIWQPLSHMASPGPKRSQASLCSLSLPQVTSLSTTTMLRQRGSFGNTEMHMRVLGRSGTLHGISLFRYATIMGRPSVPARRSRRLRLVRAGWYVGVRSAPSTSLIRPRLRGRMRQANGSCHMMIRRWCSESCRWIMLLWCMAPLESGQ